MKFKYNSFGLIILMIIVFIREGIDPLINFSYNILITVSFLFVAMNQVAVGLIGDSIITLLFKSIITFFIIDVVFEIFNFPSGKMGDFFGKIMFWIFEIPITFILNIIGRMIFR